MVAILESESKQGGELGGEEKRGKRSASPSRPRLLFRQVGGPGALCSPTSDTEKVEHTGPEALVGRENGSPAPGPTPSPLSSFPSSDPIRRSNPSSTCTDEAAKKRAVSRGRGALQHTQPPPQADPSTPRSRTSCCTAAIAHLTISSSGQPLPVVPCRHLLLKIPHQRHPQLGPLISSQGVRDDLRRHRSLDLLKGISSSSAPVQP